MATGPGPAGAGVGIVGMPVWMWAKEPDATTVGPVTAAASAGGITVTATASLLKVTWSMGDGTEVVLDGIAGLNLVAMSGNGTQHYTVGMVNNFSTAAVLWDEAGHAYKIDALLAPGTNIRTHAGYFVPPAGTTPGGGQDDEPHISP